MQKTTVLETKNDLSAFWIDFKCRWLQSGLADSEKHQTLAFLLMVGFLRIFKITNFLKILKDFLKIIITRAKMVKCILFYLNMVAQTQ